MFVLAIHWQGGRHTDVRVPRPVSGRTTRCTDAEAIALGANDGRSLAR